MLNTFSESEQQIIIHCIEIILEGEWVDPREFGSLIGVNDDKMRLVIKVIHLLSNKEVDYDRICEIYGLSRSDIRCAINNSLLQIRGIARLPKWILEDHYGLKPQEVVSVYTKWRNLRDEWSI